MVHQLHAKRHQKEGEDPIHSLGPYKLIFYHKRTPWVYTLRKTLSKNELNELSLPMSLVSSSSGSFQEFPESSYSSRIRGNDGFLKI